MKTRIVALCLLASVAGYAGNVLIFDTGTTYTKEYRTSVNTPSYEGRADVLINPLLPQDVPLQFTKVSNSLVVAMTALESNTLVAAIASNADLAIRQQANQPVTAFIGPGLVLRAFADTARDEINLLRFELSVAKTNLAVFQSRPLMPPRTLGQLQSAITNKINAGSVD